MEITTVRDTAVAKNPHGVDARQIYDHEHAQAVHITLQPGEALKRHLTPVDVLFYVLEGTGVVEIGHEKREVHHDTVIHSPARVLHCWYNESPVPLRILVVKTPKPTESTVVL